MTKTKEMFAVSYQIITDDEDMADNLIASAKAAGCLNINKQKFRISSKATTEEINTVVMNGN